MYAGCNQRLVLWWPVLSVAFFAMTHFAAQRLVGVFRGRFYKYKRMSMGHNNRNDVYHRVHCAEKHICAPDLQLIHVDHTLALLGQKVTTWAFTGARRMLAALDAGLNLL